jgi:hypothetical protein
MVKEVDAITRLYDFILWVIPKLERYPRSQKFLLADRIENLVPESCFLRKTEECII